MSRQVAVVFGRLTWLFYAGLAIPTLVLEFANDRAGFTAGLFNALVLLAFAAVGALIVARRPENRIGWLLCAGTLMWAAGILALDYATYALVTRPGALPGGDWAAVVGGSLRGFGFGILLTYVLLLFPDGQLPSPRWRPVVWFAFLAEAVFILAAWIVPSVAVDPPIAFVSSPLPIRIDASALENPIQFLLASNVMAVIICGLSVFSRLRRAQGDERQQLKWFTFAAFLGAAGLAVIMILPVFNIDPQLFNSILFTVSVAGLPVAIGIAVLKYRLYDIDLIIRRTLVYAVLTAALLVVYFGSVILLQRLFAAVTGQVQNELVTVLSTLAIAAVFVPLRNRVQEFIDRRFYRSKYDAQRVLEEFAATARDETDLERLTGRLVEVVEETMQPERVSVWLRKADK